MDETSITAAGAIDTFLVLLIGIGPKLALVPFLEITASLDPAAKSRVQRKMLTTAAAVAVILMVLGELLRADRIPPADCPDRACGADSWRCARPA